MPIVGSPSPAVARARQAAITSAPQAKAAGTTSSTRHSEAPTSPSRCSQAEDPNFHASTSRGQDVW
eukprot:3167281-Alexandrium_andersonii.AAC.1